MLISIVGIVGTTGATRSSGTMVSGGTQGTTVSAGTAATGITTGSAVSSGTTVSSGTQGTTGSLGTAGTGITTGTAASPGTTITEGTEGKTVTTLTTPVSTTKRCEEMQAVDEAVSKLITVTPNELPKGENIEFQPTSTRGVSFPKDDRTPTITVNFGKPAEVQSVTIPRDKTPNANVQQFEVTFYSPNGKKINDKPILTNSSPKDDTTKPAHLDSTQTPSNTPVSRIEITIIRTTDNESPKSVVLDIQACTEATTG
jgi:hypothetical protein